MCEFCAGIGAILSKIIGCRYIALQCNHKIVDFYKKSGFETVSDFDKENWLMVRKITDFEVDAMTVINTIEELKKIME